MSDKKPLSKQLSFEEAYDKLEKILGKLNDSKTPLGESIAMYEEAEKLVDVCTAHLDIAEKAVAKIMKKRNVGVSIEEDKQPLFEEFDEDEGS